MKNMNDPFNLAVKPMNKKKPMQNKKSGDDMFKVAKLGTEVLLGTAMIGVAAGAVRSAFSN